MAAGPTYKTEVRHEGLNKYQMVTGKDKRAVKQKAAALQARWNAEWAEKQAKHRQQMGKAAEKQAKLNLARDRQAKKQAQLALADKKTIEAERQSLPCDLY